MPDLTRRPAADVTPPRRARQGNAWTGLFGIPFIVVGIAMPFAMLPKMMDDTRGDVRVAIALLLGMAALFVGMGLSFGLSGVAMARARRRRDALANAHPGEPWYRDFEWVAEGEKERPRVDLVGRIVGIVVICLLAALVSFWGFTVSETVLSKVIAAAVDLFALWAVITIATSGVRKLRHGGVYIRYARFPFFLGDSVDVRVETHNPLPPGLPVKATLRFILERSVGGTHNQPEYFDTYSDEKPAFTDPGGIAVRFPLPDGDYETALSETNRRFWQLRLKAELEGDHFDESFVIPVYTRRS
ncbi:MAG TPA: hypothetical protein VGQ65_20785 [Thermoanaerobaculia bacterium]|jgi:hypothetical protein|nr:hypothetical protein [Thermoanaerobaculia bacterium]